MTNWWEIEHIGSAPLPAEIRAIAYYRHSAQDRQENSIPIQQEQVREWARNHSVEIIQEFADHGRSGLTSEGRPAFTDMMENWVKKRSDFEYVLCLDVSRWGRFQDIDLSAQFSAECKRAGKQVIYTTIGKPRENDPLYPVYVQFERFRAAQYSKELSEKVWRGCVKITEQGYWAGGSPPYATSRLLLDEKREPLHKLETGQRKGIQNQRVTLVDGDANEVAVIKRIFHEFVSLGFSEHRIAEGLNQDGILSPGGRTWSAGSVLGRLRNETYIGTLRYNKTSQKLKTPRKHNPPDKWVRTPEAFDGIIDSEQFLQAQLILAKRRQKYDPGFMLERLREIYEEYGFLRTSMLKTIESTPSAGSYGNEFGSFDGAFQRLYDKQRKEAREKVLALISGHFSDVIEYADFLVIDRRFSIAIEPAVAVPHGYDFYWPFRPDFREVIDITLGVFLAHSDEVEILGYAALPRLMLPNKTCRLAVTSISTELFGLNDLKYLLQF
jgi:DNA invertase Pin-like site-specific DNA recombinase